MLERAASSRAFVQKPKRWSGTLRDLICGLKAGTVSLYLTGVRFLFPCIYKRSFVML